MPRLEEKTRAEIRRRGGSAVFANGTPVPDLNDLVRTRVSTRFIDGVDFVANHAHHLLVGGLQALEAGNGVVWSSCVRGALETFGACVMILEKPGTITNHLVDVKPGKLRAAAERGKPGLKADIDRLNKIVHPGPGAVFSGVTVVEKEERSVALHLGLRQYAPHEGREGVIVLANLAHYLEENFEALATDKSVLSAGKIVMIRKGVKA